MTTTLRIADVLQTGGPPMIDRFLLSGEVSPPCITLGVGRVLMHAALKGRFLSAGIYQPISFLGKPGIEANVFGRPDAVKPEEMPQKGCGLPIRISRFQLYLRQGLAISWLCLPNLLVEGFQIFGL